MKANEMKHTDLNPSQGKDYRALLNKMMEKQKQATQPIQEEPQKTARQFGDQNFLKEYKQKDDILERESAPIDKGDFINKNVNLVLLFLVVLAITLMVGTTVYFENSFENVNKKYNDKLTELNKISDQLSTYQVLLNQTKKDLTLKAEREEDFTTKYQDIKGEKEDLARTIENLQAQRERLVGEKETLQGTIEQCTGQITLLQSENQNLRVETDKLENQVDERDRRIRQLREQVQNCGSS